MIKPLAIAGVVGAFAVMLALAGAAPDVAVSFMFSMILALAGAALLIVIIGALYGAFVAIGAAMFFHTGRKDRR